MSHDTPSDGNSTERTCCHFLPPPPSGKKNVPETQLGNTCAYIMKSCDGSREILRLNSSFSHSPTYLPTTYVSAYPTNLCTYLLTCLPTYLPTFLPPYRWFACDVMAAMLVDRNNKIFFPLGVHCHFYQNFVNKFSFVLSTNMAALQTTYTNYQRTTHPPTNHLSIHLPTYRPTYPPTNNLTTYLPIYLLPCRHACVAYNGRYVHFDTSYSFSCLLIHLCACF